MPIGKAVLTLAIPTVISQIIHILYNMADTFFIGQLNDTSQVAAATLSMPLFILMTGIANLFGMGGASLISRSLGNGDREKAKKTASFCIWSAGIFALIYGLVILVFKPYLLPILGTTETTYDYCYNYLFWTITIGAVPSVLSACLAHLIRAEGLSKEAGFGMTLGGVLNMILDPIFLFGFKMDVTGAAIATMISNFISLFYFIAVIYRHKDESVINAKSKYFTMSSYSDAAISGMGIAKKIDGLTFAVAMGMTQGVISLIGYNYSAKNYKRMNEAIKKTFLYTMVMAVITTGILFFLAVPVSRLFIDDAETVNYGQHFLKIICIICPLQTVSLMASTVFQAMGKKLQPLVLSFMRKGAVDVPAMLLINHLVGVMGIPWAIPIAELFACVVAIILIAPLMKQFADLQKTLNLEE